MKFAEFSIVWFVLLHCDVRGEESLSAEFSTESWASVALTEDVKHPHWIDEVYWRAIANGTVGDECAAILGRQSLRLISCICAYRCFHREMEPWEKLFSAEIFAAKRKTLAEMDIRKYLHITIIYSVISVIGGFGNIVILVLVRKYVKKSAVNVMITSLAVADLMVSLFTCPLEAHRTYSKAWELKPAGCMIFRYIYYVNTAASILTLTVVSAERYLAICHPMKAQRWITHSRAQKMAAALWLVSALMCVPTFFIWRDRYYKSCILSPDTITGYVKFYLAVTLFIVPCIVMIVLYSLIGRALYTSLATQRQLVNKGTKEEMKDKKGGETSAERIQVMKMLVAVVIVFMICWGPSLLLQAALRMDLSYLNFKLVYLEVEDTKILIRYLLILSYGNSAINPFLYLTSRQFRKALGKLYNSVRGYFSGEGKQPKNNDSSSSTKQSRLSDTK